MRIAETVTFGGGGLDRAAHLRGDNAALAALLNEPNTRVLPLWRGKPQLVDQGGTRTLAAVPPDHPLMDHKVEVPIFLGQSADQSWFAADVSDWTPPEGQTPDPSRFLDPTEQRFDGASEDTRFAELRAVMTQLSPLEAEIAATAKAVLGWHTTHRFCSRCGAPSEPAQAGWQRDCPACGAKHFPRTDPVVIMLITHGNSVLIGRSPGWPEGMYSLLAGFVEPGETIEAAVRREVFEEAGVRVGSVGYLSSQPWPFPASLMIGCWGEALGRDITLDPVELDDAVWVSREELLDVFAGRSERIKPARNGAIAHFILKNWLADRLS